VSAAEASQRDLGGARRAARLVPGLAADGMVQVFGKCMTVNNSGTAAGSLIVL